MQSTHQYAWIIPILPSLAAALLGLSLLFFRSATRSLRKVSALSCITLLGGAMLLSLELLQEEVAGTSAHRYLWHWLANQSVILEIGYLVDPLSTLMLVLVTTVGVAVMIYTDGYMCHDRGYVRFFAYLSLFTASMLGLVLSPNLIQLYVFWELVGMCSYLLVGFWFARPSASYACQKAFVTNRVGDFGLLLGILGFYWLTGSFEFENIASRCAELLENDPEACGLATGCALLLLLGPVAKSAQFPLHVWLPDAMEGPTPISALIHAATMVAAGIFLVARLLPLFAELPLVMDVIAWIGGLTSLLGATMALAQKDLKRCLAYSTMSQLGYMMLGLGLGSYQAGIFHLITHAYSKALLFLGSGSVIHAMENVVGPQPQKNQDMRYMGGLRRHMPITGSTFLLGTLSLCGIPPFACFWSKDEILADAWTNVPMLGFIAWFTAGLTAFYMTRMYLLTFEGEFRGALVHTNAKHQTLSSQAVNDINLLPQESSLTMTAPLVFLSVPTVLIGFLGAPWPHGIPGSSLFSQWLNPEHGALLFFSEQISNQWAEFLSTALPSVGIALIGAGIAWVFYGPWSSSDRDLIHFLDPLPQGILAPLVLSIYSWSLRRAYIDEIYDRTLIQGTRTLAGLAALVDQWPVDGTVNGTGLLALFGGESLRYTEGGRASAYLFVLFMAMTLAGLFVTAVSISSLNLS
uniref:NAD(P)H-quinone oxidoreductase subunit 5, chloroplastic n=1 Tax=Mesotaenium endlicherianum TaxID=184485 RepID=A0A024B4S6_9VIRI|nr:subunit 5 of NADH-plastoquinone oxidoreductase [Mesotaenium endlicherianum]AHZ11191.1 subunit 5 of NADH-plastoquinone oxidoreductase [Mesotaenium endlicherianum]